MIVYLDTVRGVLMDGLNGNDLAPIAFVLRDIVEFDVVFTDGAGNNITASLLNSSTYLNIALTSLPVVNGNVLALAGAFTLVGGVAKTVFSLNTTNLVNYFIANEPNNSNNAAMRLEIQVAAVDNSARDTYFQGICFVKAVVSYNGDTPPTPITPPTIPTYMLVHMEVTTRTGGLSTSLDYLTTLGLNKPMPCIIRPGGVGGTGEWWCLDLWDGVTASDGVFAVNPLDFDPTTNRVQWRRVI